MNDQDPSAPSERRVSEAESLLSPRGIWPGTPGAKTEANRQARQPAAEPKQLKIVVQLAPPEARPSEESKPVAAAPVPPVSNPPPLQDASLQRPATLETPESRLRTEAEPQQIP